MFLYTDKSTALHGSLRRYFNNPTFSDITVVAPDGLKLAVHQLVLSACSARFASMLEQGAQPRLCAHTACWLHCCAQCTQHVPPPAQLRRAQPTLAKGHAFPQLHHPSLRRLAGGLAGEDLPVWGVGSEALEAILRFFYTGQQWIRGSLSNSIRPMQCCTQCHTCAAGALAYLANPPCALRMPCSANSMLETPQARYPFVAVVGNS